LCAKANRKYTGTAEASKVNYLELNESLTPEKVAGSFLTGAGASKLGDFATVSSSVGEYWLFKASIQSAPDQRHFLQRHDEEARDVLPAETPEVRLPKRLVQGCVEVITRVDAKDALPVVPTEVVSAFGKLRRQCSPA
jgi:hypothetical protein